MRKKHWNDCDTGWTVISLHVCCVCCICCVFHVCHVGHECNLGGIADLCIAPQSNVLIADGYEVHLKGSERVNSTPKHLLKPISSQCETPPLPSLPTSPALSCKLVATFPKETSVSRHKPRRRRSKSRNVAKRGYLKRMSDLMTSSLRSLVRRVWAQLIGRTNT